jgi:hypothetical protein
MSPSAFRSPWATDTALYVAFYALVTRTPCLMLTLGRQQFEQILTAVPDLRIAFEQVAAARRREDEAILGLL